MEKILKKQRNIQKIIDIIKDEMKNYDQPIVSSLDKAGIKKTPFTTLVSCLLSLRTKDEITEEASIKLFKDFDTAEKLSNASKKEIEKIIYPVGFYRVKSERIINISNEIVEKYNGSVPNTFNELLKLKGVGKKTASIVMVYGHNNPNYIPVDVHVHVISNRLGLVKTKNADDTMDELMKIVPKKYWADINHLFVKFGKKICTTISPWCSKCPIEKYCKKIGVDKNR